MKTPTQPNGELDLDTLDRVSGGTSTASDTELNRTKATLDAIHKIFFGTTGSSGGGSSSSGGTSSSGGSSTPPPS